MGDARTFDEVAASYLKRQALYGRDVQTIGYQVRILLRYFSGRPIAGILPREIETMIAHRLEQGVAQSTTNRQRAHLSGIFSYAIYEGLHPGPNPVRQVRKFRESPGRLRFLSREEARHLVAVAPAHIRLLILFGLYTGARLREMLGLRWTDVQISEHPIRGDNGRLICGMVHYGRETAKNGRGRVVPISEELAHAIRCAGRHSPADWIFTFRGRPLRSVRTAFEAAKHRAGLGREVVFHTLRHTFCSHYVMNGGRVSDLMELVGWSSEALSRRYVHLSPAHIRNSGAYIGAPQEPETQD